MGLGTAWLSASVSLPGSADVGPGDVGPGEVWGFGVVRCWWGAGAVGAACAETLAGAAAPAERLDLDTFSNPLPLRDRPRRSARGRPLQASPDLHVGRVAPAV